MKMLKVLRGLAVTAATFGILIPIPTIVNATEIGAASRQGEVVRDLALGAGGVIRGQVVNKDGLPDRGADVSVIRNGETVTTVKTDDQGSFAIAGISGGVYAISSGKATGVVRAGRTRPRPRQLHKAFCLSPVTSQSAVKAAYTTGYITTIILA